jgi:hypothetical protein
VSFDFSDRLYDFPEICQGNGLGGSPLKSGVFWRIFAKITVILAGIFEN